MLHSSDHFGLINLEDVLLFESTLGTIKEDGDGEDVKEDQPLVLLNIPQNSTPSAPIPSCLSAFTIDLTNLSTDKVTTV